MAGPLKYKTKLLTAFLFLAAFENGHHETIQAAVVEELSSAGEFEKSMLSHYVS